MFARLVIRGAGEASHTYVTRPVVIACQDHRAYRPGFESHATSATDISEVRSVSIITRISSQAVDDRRSLFASYRKFAVLAVYMSHAKFMYVTHGFATHASNTKR
jgi:hypothetical protein